MRRLSAVNLVSLFSSFRRAAVAALLAIAAVPCFASQVAVLKNGFSIRHERHEIVGDVTRLYVNPEGSSFVDVPTEDIDHYEAAPDLPSSSALPQSASTVPAAAPRSVAGSLSSKAPARPINITEVVKEASGKYRLDPDLVNSVIKAESGFNVRAVSPKGAQGLMQLMPGTASQLGVPNTFDAQQNVEGGTKYLRELMERYNFDIPKALAAYNAGPQRVEQFRGIPPYYETRAYVARIVKDFNKKKLAQQKAAAVTKKTTSPRAAASKVRAVAAKKKPEGAVQAKAAMGSQ